jgi:rubredoxin
MIADPSGSRRNVPLRFGWRRGRFPGASLGRVKWMCESCGFIYDPEIGDPDGGIPPGTAFEDIPETWFCPVCGARKRDFTPYED